jgi:hypothetical protein
MLTREHILAAQDRASEDVAVPEWGGAVRVSAMSGAQRDHFEQSLLVDGRPDTTNAHAKLVAACVVDESGEPLFSAADIEALGKKSAAALGRIVAVARRLNRLGTDELEVAKGN